jgi:glycosyltransferase involved in cell wall biosynthesis
LTNRKKITVAQILPSLNSGGVERGTLEIADFLIKRGHKSIVISEGGRLVENLENNGSIHIKMTVGRKSFFTLFLIPKLIRIILNQKIDVIDVRSRLPAWLVFISLKLIPKNRRPFLVTTVHGYNSISSYSKIMTKGDIVITVSNFIKDFIVENYKIKTNKIKVIPRGVPGNLKNKNEKKFTQWKNNFIKELHINEDYKILTICARVSRTKGIQSFIDLIYELTLLNENIFGLIVGEQKSTNYSEYLKSYIKKLNIEKNISFTGYRDDVYNIIQLSEITYCLSEVPEPFGRVVIESINLGTPIIGYNQGGVGEQLNKIFPDGIIQDKKKLLEKTIKFLKNKPKVQNSNFYSLTKMQLKTIKVYESFFTRP